MREKQCNFSVGQADFQDIGSCTYILSVSKCFLLEKVCTLCWFVLCLSRFPLQSEFLPPVISGYTQFSDQSSKPNKTIIFPNKKGLPRTNSNPNSNPKYKNFTLFLLPQNSSSCIQTGGEGRNVPFCHCFILSKVDGCLEISVRYKSPHFFDKLTQHYPEMLDISEL